MKRFFNYKKIKSLFVAFTLATSSITPIAFQEVEAATEPLQDATSLEFTITTANSLDKALASANEIAEGGSLILKFQSGGNNQFRLTESNLVSIRGLQANNINVIFQPTDPEKTMKLICDTDISLPVSGNNCFEFQNINFSFASSSCKIYVNGSRINLNNSEIIDGIGSIEYNKAYTSLEFTITTADSLNEALARANEIAEGDTLTLKFQSGGSNQFRLTASNLESIKNLQATNINVIFKPTNPGEIMKLISSDSISLPRSGNNYFEFQDINFSFASSSCKIYLNGSRLELKNSQILVDGNGSIEDGQPDTSVEFTITTAESLDEALARANEIVEGDTLTLKFRSGGSNQFRLTASNLESIKNLQANNINIIFQPTNPGEIMKLISSDSISLPRSGDNYFEFQDINFSFASSSCKIYLNGSRIKLNNSEIIDGIGSIEDGQADTSVEFTITTAESLDEALARANEIVEGDTLTLKFRSGGNNQFRLTASNLESIKNLQAKNINVIFQPTNPGEIMKLISSNSISLPRSGNNYFEFQDINFSFASSSCKIYLNGSRLELKNSQIIDGIGSIEDGQADTSAELIITTAESLDEALARANGMVAGDTLTLKFRSGGSNQFRLTASNLESIKNLQANNINIIFQPTNPGEIMKLISDADISLPRNGNNYFEFQDIRISFTSSSCKIYLNGSRLELKNSEIVIGGNGSIEDGQVDTSLEFTITTAESLDEALARANEIIAGDTLTLKFRSGGSNQFRLTASNLKSIKNLQANNINVIFQPTNPGEIMKLISSTSISLPVFGNNYFEFQDINFSFASSSCKIYVNGSRINLNNSEIIDGIGSVEESREFNFEVTTADTFDRVLTTISHSVYDNAIFYVRFQDDFYLFTENNIDTLRKLYSNNARNIKIVFTSANPNKKMTLATPCANMVLPENSDIEFIFQNINFNFYSTTACLVTRGSECTIDPSCTITNPIVDYANTMEFTITTPDTLEKALSRANELAEGGTLTLKFANDYKLTESNLQAIKYMQVKNSTVIFRTITSGQIMKLISDTDISLPVSGNNRFNFQDITFSFASNSCRLYTNDTQVYLYNSQVENQIGGIYSGRPTSLEYTITTSESLDKALARADEIAEGGTLTLSFQSGGNNQYRLTASNLESIKNLQAKKINVIFKPTNPGEIMMLITDADISLPTSGNNRFEFQDIHFSFGKQGLKLYVNGSRLELKNAGIINGIGTIVW